MTLYDIEFRVKNHKNNEFNGFEAIKTADYFEPSWDINLLYHDIIEHFFEWSKYFSTPQLSQAGECVAMGIRSYLSDYSCLTTEFADYNKYKGIDWNSWTTCLSQISEAKEENSQYPNDFNYQYLKSWNRKNIFKGYAEKYDEFYEVKEFYKQVELAFSYGYWLGEKLFSSRIEIIYRFFTHLRQFLQELELDSLNMYDTAYNLNEGSRFKVEVKSNNIVGNFDGVLITSNIDGYKSANKYLNKIYE
jgi:hypothetical protein